MGDGKKCSIESEKNGALVEERARLSVLITLAETTAAVPLNAVGFPR